jgi:3-methyladenine DNA glycosylase Mpg
MDLTTGESIWFEDRGVEVKRGDVGTHSRVGVDYAGEWAKKPWRFRLRTVASTRRTRRTKNTGAPHRSAPVVSISHRTR